MNQGLGIAWTGSLGKHVVSLSSEDSNRLEKYLPTWARYRLYSFDYFEDVPCSVSCHSHFTGIL